MDSTDYKIIEILQQDGRISMKDLGKLVGLTSPAVSERVKRLEEFGVIEGYKAVVNPQKLNKNIKAFINVSIPSEKYSAFLDSAIHDNNIFECHHITGQDSLILKIMVENMGELEKMIDSIKKIGSTQTSLILSSPIESKIIR